MIRAFQSTPIFFESWRVGIEKCTAEKKYLYTSAVVWSKVGKRRKDDRLKLAPHLEIISKQKQKKMAKDHCLEHFDTFYKKTFERQWPSLRLAMLSRPKFCALVNNYGDRDTTFKRLNRMGCYSINKVYQDQVKYVKSRIDMDQVPSIDNKDQDQHLDIDLPSSDLLSSISSSSMTPEIAAKRIIHPDEMIMQGGGGSDIDAASASMYDFVPSTRIKGMDDFVEESEYYSVHDTMRTDRYQREAMPIERREQGVLDFPEHIEAYTFAPGATDMRLESPEKGCLGTFDYYCMDAASLLPVLALGIQKGDSVLDMCAAPGGKTLAIIQTMMPCRVVANDRDHARMKRLLDVMSAYLQTYDTNFAEELVEFKRSSGLSLPYQMANSFDKVLCDVPCTSDRTSVHQDEGNIFNVSRKKLRLKIPEEQSNLLQSAMKCVKPGGSVVYSTCTLSPIQNDGVVYDALKQTWKNDGLEFIVEDLSTAIKPFRSIMRFADEFTATPSYYGQLVLPNVINNFGPMYFAKITRK